MSLFLDVLNILVLENTFKKLFELFTMDAIVQSDYQWVQVVDLRLIEVYSRVAPFLHLVFY